MSKYYATITGPDGKEMKVMVIPVREIRGQTLIFLAIEENWSGHGARQALVRTRSKRARVVALFVTRRERS
jgi:hypothetical protein